MTKKKSMAKGTYYMAEVYCSNCGHKSLVHIDKGVAVYKYKSGRICENCGCFMNV